MGGKRKRGRKNLGGRPLVHGAYNTLRRNVVKGQPRLRRFLTSCREGLIADTAGTEERLTTGQLIIIDRCIGKLAILRLMEAYVAEVGAFKDGELLPLLAGPYLRFTDSLRADLLALGIERRSHEKVLTPLELVQVIEAEEVAKEKGDEDGHSQTDT